MIGATKDKDPFAMPTFEEFSPAIQIDIDCGAVGVKQSSAQLTTRYVPEDLVGRQVVAVLNFPPRRVADYLSEVLVLGAMAAEGGVVLLDVDSPVANGTRIA